MKNFFLLPFLLLSITLWSQDQRKAETTDDGWRLATIHASDIDSFKKMDRKTDIIIAGGMNTFFGNAKDYFSTGGGFLMTTNMRGRNGFGGGINIALYGNSITQQIPDKFQIPQKTKNLSGLFGFNVHKVLIEKPRNELTVQVDLNFMMHNYLQPTEGTSQNAPAGFSPGVMFNYSFQIGRENIGRNMNDAWGFMNAPPAAFSHYFNIHSGFRRLFNSQSPFSGYMFELGIGYKLRNSPIKAYKLKKNALRKNETIR